MHVWRQAVGLALLNQFKTFHEQPLGCPCVFSVIWRKLLIATQYLSEKSRFHFFPEIIQPYPVVYNWNSASVSLYFQQGVFCFVLRRPNDHHEPSLRGPLQHHAISRSPLGRHRQGRGHAKDHRQGSFGWVFLGGVLGWERRYSTASRADMHDVSLVSM